MDKFGNITQSHFSSAPSQKVMTMVKNERMGGYVPKWEARPATPQTAIEQNLSHAQSAQKGVTAENALAYSGAPAEDMPLTKTEEFTFSDIVDMVNPLHHIPLVNHAYRHISGDEIKPIGQIIGGAVFGGPLGAASGLVNVIIEEETGKDLTGNAIAMARGETPSFRKAGDQNQTQNPETRLNEAVQIAQGYEDLSNSLLAFSNLSHSQEIVIERKEQKTTPTHISRRYND